MRKSNKKGFTIVELVIVIAVIAILAAVLIPTFSNVIKKANESAALQAVRNAYSEAQIALSGSGRTLAEGTYFSDEDGKFFFKLDGSGIVKADTEPSDDAKKAYATLENGVRIYGVKIEKTTTISASSGDPVVLFAEPVKGASSATLTVYDADGNQYYSESATGNSTFSTGLYFCMYNTSKDANNKTATWDAKANVSNKLANCMSDEDAYGWYSYVLTYTSSNVTKTVTGVFYYGE